MRYECVRKINARCSKYIHHATMSEVAAVSEAAAAASDTFDASKPMAPGEVRTLHVVHMGSRPSKSGGEDLVNAITFRVKREEAEDVAQFLNQMQEEVWYFQELASKANHNGRGGAAELMAFDTDETRALWEQKFATFRKPVFQVTAVRVAEQCVEKFDELTASASEATK